MSLELITLLTYLLSIFFFVFKKNVPLALTFLLIGSFLLRLFLTQSTDLLYIWDEQYHALVAKSLSNDPLHPLLYRETPLWFNIEDWGLNHVWLHKQPLFLWQIAASIKVLGLTPFAVKFPSIVMSTLWILGVYKLGKVIVDKEVGFIAAVIISTYYLFIDFVTGAASTDHNDVAFLFYLTWSIYFYFAFTTTKNRRYIILIGLFSGLAILNKWLVGLLVYAGWGAKLVADYLEKKELNGWKDLIYSLLITIVVFVPWQLFIINTFPIESKIEYDLNTKHFFEVVEGHSGEWYFYIQNFQKHFSWLIVALLPFAFFFLKKQVKESSYFYLICLYISVVFIFFSISATKMIGFTMITYPFFFIAISCLLLAIINRVKHLTLRKIVLSLSLALFTFHSFNYANFQKKYTDDSRDFSKYYTRVVHKIATHTSRIINEEYQDQKVVVFNNQQSVHIQIMFYSDAIAYDFTPDENHIKEVIAKGYIPIVIDSENNRIEREYSKKVIRYTLPEYY